MNQSFAARRQLRVPAIVVGLALLLHMVLVPAAYATVTDAYGSAYDLTPALSANPFTFSDAATSVSTFTRDAVETDGLSACGSYPANPTNTYSVWYSFTPPSAGWLTLQTMDSNTNYDTVIEVWKSSPTPANSVGCNDDAIAGNRRSELTLQVATSTPYLISVRRHGTSTMTSPMLAFDASFSASREFFVDQTLGSDANTGSQALPFRTVGHAESMLPAAGGIITILDPGVYNEAVTIDVPTNLRSASSSTIASVTLKSTPVSATSVNASTVTVQPGAKVQEGVDLAETGGWLWLANGTYTETVTIARDLTVQAQNEGVPTLAAPGGTPLTLNGGAVTVKGLNIHGVTGVVVAGGAGHTVTRNNIAGNSSGVGMNNQSGTQVSATSNWWGCSTGPSAAPCDTAKLDPAAGSASPLGTGTLNFTPWLRVATTAAAAPLVVGQATGVTASFLTDSNGGAVSLSNLATVLGLPVTWSTVGGTLSGQQSTIQISGTAAGSYQAQAVSAGNKIIAKVDNDGTASGSNVLTIAVNKASTSTGITADTPDPSVPGQAVTVNYSVSASAPGAGTPTGNVTVSDGVNSCTATVAAGTCSITLSTVGARTLTATYAGDANFSGSTSAGAAHTVAAPTPTATNTPTSTPTNTPTNTPTSTPTN
ncbi:hypothetical protein SE17_16325, partial [Kouleothrix aurantiaca]